jgi:hypothetical protein
LIQGAGKRDGCTIAAAFDVKKQIRVEIALSPNGPHGID